MGSRQFLCEEHYKEFRNEREKDRIKFRRKGYDVVRVDGKYYKKKVTKENEYNTKLGSSDFGGHLRRDSSGNPDFDNEASFVKKELNRIKRRKTIGDHANKFAGNNDESHLPESRGRMLDSNNLAFNKDENGYVQYDSEGVKNDSWETQKEQGNFVDVEDVDEFFNEPEKKTKSRKDIYKDWNY